MKSKITQWIDDHDDRWSFIVFYIGLSVIFSIYLNLFWVALLAGGHLGLEITRHLMLKMDRPVLRALWEVKLDIALILLAVNLSLYSDMMVAALGLGQTARAASALRGAQMATRFTIIQRALRIFMMTVDDMARVAQAIYRALFNRKAAETVPAMPHHHDAADTAILATRGIAPWHEPSRGDWFALVFGGICALLIIGAPVLAKHSLPETLAIIAGDFTP